MNEIFLSLEEKSIIKNYYKRCNSKINGWDSEDIFKSLDQRIGFGHIAHYNQFQESRKYFTERINEEIIESFKRSFYTDENGNKKKRRYENSKLIPEINLDLYEEKKVQILKLMTKRFCNFMKYLKKMNTWEIEMEDPCSFLYGSFYNTNPWKKKIPKDKVA